MFPLSLRRLIASLSRTSLRVGRPAAWRRRRTFRPEIEFLEGRTTPSVDVWTGAVDTNWSNDQNWSLLHAPYASDVAQFTATNGWNTATVNQNVTVAGLQIDVSWNGTINVNNNTSLTLASGSVNEWDSGNINVGVLGGSLVNNGTLTLNNPLKAVNLNGGGTLQNNGTINQPGAGGLIVNGTSNVATTLANAAGATYDFQADSYVSYIFGAGGVITNAGLIEKTAGSGAAAIYTALANNGGTLDAAAGTLSLATTATTDTNGTFGAAAGATLDLTGGTLSTFTENGTFTGAGAGTIALDSGYLAAGPTGATFNIPSTLAFDWSGGNITIPVNTTLTCNGTLTLDNPASSVILQGGGTLQNNGTINQAGAGGLTLESPNNNVATTLVNAAGATYDFQADSYISYIFGAAGVVRNAGLIEKTAGSGTATIYAVLVNNSGTLDAAAGTLSLATVATADTNGTFDAAAGATLDLTGNAGITFTENGTFTGAGAGTIMLDNGTLAAGPTGATLNIPTGLAFDWSGGNISVPTNTTLTCNGTLTLDNPASSVILQGGGTLQNNGTINQAGAGGLTLESPNNNVATTLVNAAGATYDFQADSYISWIFGAAGVVRNAGLIEKTAGSGTAAIYTPLVNNGGTLDAASGTLQLATNTTDTNGTFQATAGATLNLTGGNTIAELGSLTAGGTGTVTLGGGTLAVANNAVNLSLPSTLSFQWTGGAIDVPTSDTLTVNGNLTFVGASNEVLYGGGTLIEKGTITQSGTGSLLLTGTSNLTTTLVLPKGSVYDFAANSGIGYGGGQGGVVDNSGTIEKTGGGASSWLNVAFNNTGGTLAATTGTLTLDTTGGENTGGAFNVSTGAVLDLTGGNSVNYTGTWTGSGSGEVLLDGGTLNTTGGTNGAAFNLPGNLFVWTGGTINTAAANNFTLLGSMKITGNGTEDLTGGGELNIGTATAPGTLNDTTTANTLNIGQGSTLGINARGTLNLADDTISGGGLLLDQGSLVKTAGTSGATISTTVDSQGKVTVNNGTLLFNGFVDQVFNGVLTGGSWTASSNATTAATLDIRSATFNTIGVGASVTLSGPHSSFSNLSGLSANQGTFSLSSGATFATSGNFTNSGTMTLSPGSTLTVNGAFAQTSTGTLTEQIGGTASKPTFGSIVSTSAVSLGGTLNVTSTVVPAVGSSFEIVNNGSAAPISGTFAGLPEGATFTVKVGATTMTFKISYVGGPGGKNVVLTRIS
jgi:hypothetical protein